MSGELRRVRLERAHGESEVQQAILDQTLHVLLRAEHAGDPHESLEEVDRVGGAMLDGTPNRRVPFHH